jgi:Ca-activated chloride channel family protein
MLANPVLTDVQVAFDGLDVYDVVPGKAPDLFAEKPVIIFGKYKGKPNGEIKLTARGATGPFTQTLNVRAENASKNLSALKYLWARHKIASLEDQRRVFNDAGQNEAIRALGLRYHLMTEFTSFVAVDRSRKVDTTGAVSVDQALPLPDGVSSNMATTGRRALLKRSSKRYAPAPTAPPPVQGGLGSTGGESYGVGGLGLRGTGRGGGGSGYGKVAAESKSLAGPADKKEKPKARPKVKAGHPQVKGALDKNVILRVIRQRQAQMRYCYERALRKNPGLSGTLKVQWSIDANGRVQAVKIRSGSLNDSKMRQCVIRQVKKMRFPKPSGGGSVKVIFPFKFSPS